MLVHTEYQVRTLAELIEVCQAIHNECGNVDPNTILVGTSEISSLHLELCEIRLSDGSTVFDVEVA